MTFNEAIEQERERLTDHYVDKWLWEQERTFTVSDEKEFREYLEGAVSYAVACMLVVKYFPMEINTIRKKDLRETIRVLQQRNEDLEGKVEFYRGLLDKEIEDRR